MIDEKWVNASTKSFGLHTGRAPDHAVRRLARFTRLAGGVAVLGFEEIDGAFLATVAIDFGIDGFETRRTYFAKIAIQSRRRSFGTGLA